MRPFKILPYVAAASAAFAVTAHAGEVPYYPLPSELQTSQPREPVGDGQDAAVQLPQRLELEELDNARGRATIVLNDQEIDGTVTGNSLGDYSAGSITLSDNALSNFNGVGNFLFNTGAQNNLQAGMTLTIVVDD